jgi:hypothetical protein
VYFEKLTPVKDVMGTSKMQKDLTWLSTKPSRFWQFLFTGVFLGSILERLEKKLAVSFAHLKGLKLDPFPVLKTLSYFYDTLVGTL